MYKRQVVALIAGKNAPKGTSMGHAGAIVSADGTGSAENKEKKLSEAGVIIAESTEDVYKRQLLQTDGSGSCFK